MALSARCIFPIPTACRWKSPGGSPAMTRSWLRNLLRTAPRLLTGLPPSGRRPHELPAPAAAAGLSRAGGPARHLWRHRWCRRVAGASSEARCAVGHHRHLHAPDGHHALSAAAAGIGGGRCPCPHRRLALSQQRQRADHGKGRHRSWQMGRSCPAQARLCPGDSRRLVRRRQLGAVLPGRGREAAGDDDPGGRPTRPDTGGATARRWRHAARRPCQPRPYADRMDGPVDHR